MDTQTNQLGNTNHQSQDALCSALLEIFFTDTIGHYHVDTAAEALSRLPRDLVAPVLSQTRLIAWSVSDLLAFSFLKHAEEALKVLTTDQLVDWVRGALAVYEAEGLRPAERYLADVHETSLLFADTERAACLEDAAKRLHLLTVGLTGQDLPIRPSDTICTDTASIFAPRTLVRLSSAEANRLLYRILVVHKCAQIRYRSFHMPLPALEETLPEDLARRLEPDPARKTVGLEALCSVLPCREKAGLLLALVDTIRVEAAIADDFPGLWQGISQLKALLRQGRCPARRNSPPASSLIAWILGNYDAQGPCLETPLRQEVLELRAPRVSALKSAHVTALVAMADPELQGLEEMNEILPYIGTISPTAVARELLPRRQQCRERFVEIVASMLIDRNGTDGNRGESKDRPISPNGPTIGEGERAVALILPPGERAEVDPNRLPPQECLLLGGEDIELTQEFRELLSEIQADLGDVPSSYISGAQALASGSWFPVDVCPQTEETSLETTHRYDEWDFRRQAYRRNWCSLKEMEVPITGGDLVAQTLQRYRGQVMTLRRQFEMLRHGHRFLRRQREGEEIDLDAAVQAYADIQAAATPSERLFIQQQRDVRDIAVAFLVDMSASTEGWVNKAIKELLVLLCEALHVLGDRYAIYGFSGMRRTRCQFFRIKDFDEGYDQTAKGRITGINARDYTRMGPPIRHAAKLLQDVEARLKILITLSDGKPEDYDGYKGHYAIEDTRRALIEARQQGVSPFCITIDRQARDYLPHMYGEVSYIVVEDVTLLHRRVPEIYRLLTT